MAVPVIETFAISNQTSNATSKSDVTSPSSVVNNDIVLIFIAMDGDAANPEANADGFATLTSFPQGADELYILWKRSSGSEPANYTVNWTGSEQARFMTVRVSGCITTDDPWDVISSGVSNSASTTNVISRLTSTVIDTLALYAVAVDRDRVDGADTITGTGWTEVGTSGSSGGANGAGLIVGENDMPSIEQVEAGTFGTWQSDQNASRGFNLKSPPGAITKTHTTDSLLQKLDNLLTHTTNSLLKKLDNIKTHPTDSLLKALGIGGQCFIADFADDYETDNGWTQVSSGVTVDSGTVNKVDWANVDGDTDRRVHKSLGITLSNSTWVCEWEFHPTADASTPEPLVLCLTAGTDTPKTASQDGLGIEWEGGGQDAARLWYKDDTGAWTQSSGSIVTGFNLRFYRLERTSTTNLKLSIFSDVNKTIEISGSPINFTIPATVTELTHIQHSVEGNGIAGRRITATGDKLRIYDGVNFPFNKQQVCHTTDSLLQIIDNLKTHTTDSTLKKHDTKTHNTDSFLENYTIISTIQLDIPVVKSHTTDSFLQAAGAETKTITHTTDSLLKSIDNTKTHTTDSLLKSIDNLLTHTTDSLLKKLANLKTHTTDSLLKAIDNLLTHTTDSLLKSIDNTITHTTDSLLQPLVFHTTDSLLKAIDNLKTHTTDSLLKKIDDTKTHTTNSLLKSLDNLLTHTTDSLLKAIDNLVTHTTDSLLKKHDTRTHTTDSFLVVTGVSKTRSHTTDSLLKKLDNTITHTTDSFLINKRILTHTTDSLLKATDNLLTHTTDSLLKAIDNEIIHTTDSLLKAIDSTVIHTTDSLLKSLDNTVIHTTDSLLKSTDNLLTHTTDSLLKSIDNLLTHDTDSLLKAVDNTKTHTTDSFLATPLKQTKTHSTDSFLIGRERGAVRKTLRFKRLNSVIIPFKRLLRKTLAFQRDERITVRFK